MSGNDGQAQLKMTLFHTDVLYVRKTQKVIPMHFKKKIFKLERKLNDKTNGVILTKKNIMIKIRIVDLD